MIHPHLFHINEEPGSLELTPDLEELLSSQQISVTLGKEGVCLRVLHRQEEVVQEITLSHTQMGLLVNAWNAYYDPHLPGRTSVERSIPGEGG
jgi:hypothetical protein